MGAAPPPFCYPYFSYAGYFSPYKTTFDPQVRELRMALSYYWILLKFSINSQRQPCNAAGAGVQMCLWALCTESQDARDFNVLMSDDFIGICSQTLAAFFFCLELSWQWSLQDLFFFFKYWPASQRQLCQSEKVKWICSLQASPKCVTLPRANPCTG